VPVGIDIAPDFDGLFWGFVLATAFFGCTIVQAWIYLNTNQDSWPFRLFVGSLILADFTTTALNAQTIHFCLLTNFGNPIPLVQTTKTINAEFALTAIIAFATQMFFASRVYLFKKNQWVIPAVIVAFAVGQLVAGLLGAALLFKHPVVALLTTTAMKIRFGMNGGLATVADVTATVALSWYLSSVRSGIKRTDTVLQRLLVYVVTRGLLITVAQILYVVIYLSFPTKLFWMPLHLILSKLYVITLVAMLNGRSTLRDNFSKPVTDTSMFTASSSGMARTPQASRKDGVTITQTIELSSFPEMGSMSYGDEPRAKGSLA